MEIIWSVFLGAVQGITEFFPVSSSGHLAVLPFILNFKDPGLAFDIALHAGTLVAILWVFQKEWLALIAGVLKKEDKQLKLASFLLLTSIPGAIAGYLLEDKAATVFRNPALIATTLIIFGLILYWTDKQMPQNKNYETLGVKNAILIGLAQAMAIVPGVSRSGATVTAGRLLGLKREDAFKYSFLAAAPIIFGATIFGLRDVKIQELTSLNWLWGFLAAIVASVWAMKFLVKYVKNHDFKLFVWWRLILGALIYLLILIRT